MMHVYEADPRKDHGGVDLISDAPPFGRLCYDTPDNAIDYAMHSSRSQRCCDPSGFPEIGGDVFPVLHAPRGFSR
jgi:hypothetical protein